MVADAPGLLKLDRRDRSDFLRHFYRRYEDAPVDQLAVDSVELFNQLILTKAFPAGIRRVREHRALGHRTVLITGALDFVVAPLRPLFDDIVCARMSTDERDGVERYTGRVTDAALVAVVAALADPSVPCGWSIQPGGLWHSCSNWRASRSPICLERLLIWLQ